MLKISLAVLSVLSIINSVTGIPRAPPKGGKFFYSDYTKDDSGFYWTSVLLGNEYENVEFNLLIATSQF